MNRLFFNHYSLEYNKNYKFELNVKVYKLDVHNVFFPYGYLINWALVKVEVLF